MNSIRRLSQIFCAAAIVAILPAEAMAQWAKDYDRGVEELQNGQWSAAAASFHAALRRRSKPELNAREYGVGFFEYFPYYQLGRALFFQLDFAGAIENFEQELAYGVIQKSRAYQDLLKLRETAKALQEKLSAGSTAAIEPEPDVSVWITLLNVSFRRGRGAQRSPNIDSLLAPLKIGEKPREQILQWFGRLPQPSASNVTVIDSVSMLKNVAIAAFLQGQYREALAHFNRLAQIAPNEPMLADWQQRVRFELSRLEPIPNEPLLKTDTVKIVQSGAPMIIIREPDAEVSRSRKKQVRLNGTVHDDIGIAAIELVVNGEPLQVADGLTRWQPNRNEDGTYSFSRDIPLTMGENQIVVTAYDLDGEPHRSTQMRRILRQSPLHQTTPFWLLIGSGVLVALGLIAGNRFIKYRIAFVHRYNPYIAGAPIRDEEMFYGRQQLLERILRTLPNNSLMVYGARRIGKTSFQYQLQRVLKERPHPEYHFTPVFIDLQGVAEEVFFAHLLEELREQLGPEIAAAIPAPLDRQKYGHREFANALRDAINILQTRQNKKGPSEAGKKIRLVFLIDEVDELNRYSERTNQRLRAIFMKSFSENLVAVLTGSNIRQQWESESSPWYNFFEQVPMPALAREEAMQLIQRPVKGFFTYTPEATERIWQASQGKPFVIQKFCVRLVNLAIEKRHRKIVAADVEAIRHEVLHDTTPTAANMASSGGAYVDQQ